MVTLLLDVGKQILTLALPSARSQPKIKGKKAETLRNGNTGPSGLSTLQEGNVGTQEGACGHAHTVPRCRGHRRERRPCDLRVPVISSVSRTAAHFSSKLRTLLLGSSVERWAPGPGGAGLVRPPGLSTCLNIREKRGATGHLPETQNLLGVKISGTKLLGSFRGGPTQELFGGIRNALLVSHKQLHICSVGRMGEPVLSVHSWNGVCRQAALPVLPSRVFLRIRCILSPTNVGFKKD